MKGSNFCSISCHSKFLPVQAFNMQVFEKKVGKVEHMMMSKNYFPKLSTIVDWIKSEKMGKTGQVGRRRERERRHVLLLTQFPTITVFHCAKLSKTCVFNLANIDNSLHVFNNF